MHEDVTEVRLCLRKADRPLDCREVALGAFEGAGADEVNRASRALRALVNEERVERVHGPAGLRYKLVGKDYPDDSATAPSAADAGDSADADEPDNAGASILYRRAHTDPVGSNETQLPAHDLRIGGAHRALKDRVLQAIRDAGGALRSVDLTETVFKGVGRNTRQYVLLQLKAHGEVLTSGYASGTTIRLPSQPQPALEAATDDVTTELATTPAEAVPANEGPSQAVHPTQSEASGHAENGDRVLKALKFSATVSQDALDAYLMAIADATVVVPLMRARDLSRQALNAWIEGGQP